MQDMIRRYAGWAGLALLLAASVDYGVGGQALWHFWTLFALALLGLGAYLFYERGQVLEALRSRKARAGANSVFLGAAALAIAALGMAIINNHDLSWDLTKNKVHTLSDETEKAMQGLSVQVKLFAFYEPNQQPPFEELLRKAKKLNPSKFSYEFVNLNKKPLLAQQYSVRSYGTSVLVAGDPEAPGARSETINSSKEEDLVNALLKLSSTGTKAVYFLSGHGEANPSDTGPGGASELKKALEHATFSVKELNLAREGKVPADAAALILAGPKVDAPAAEAEALRAWLSSGGRLVAALDPRMRLPNFGRLLADAGVALGGDIVVDPIMRIFGADPVVPLASTFDNSHPVSSPMHSGQQMAFPLSQSVALKETLAGGVNGTVLATSNPTAWGYRGQGNQIPSKPSASDLKGPVKLAVALEGPGSVLKAGAQGRNFRLVAYGTSHLLSNDGIGMYNNQDLTVNSARWLSDEEKKISIAARKEESQPLMLDRGRSALIWWSVLLLPLGILALGTGVLLRRRRMA
jgi:ABC-type uncharacterized transport system involved in gliding motility auxiliary subunit